MTRKNIFLDSLKLFYKNSPNILIFLLFKIILILFYWKNDNLPILYFITIYDIFFRIILLTMLCKALISNDIRRISIVGFFRNINISYKKITRPFLLYFVISLILVIIHISLDSLLKYLYGMHEKSSLSVLIDNTFHNITELLMCLIIYAAISNLCNSSFVQNSKSFYYVFKQNILSFCCIFFITLSIPYLFLKLLGLYIKYFVTSSISEFMEIWNEFIMQPLASFVFNFEINVTHFLTSIYILENDLEFIFSIYFYILFFSSIIQKNVIRKDLPSSF